MGFRVKNKRCFQLLAAVYFSVHVLLLLVWNAGLEPHTWVKTPAGVAWYMSLTNSVQAWGVFQSLPIIHDLRAVVQVIDEDGTPHMLNPILPGFKSHDYHSRVFGFFLTLMALPPQAPYLRSYVMQVCKNYEVMYGKPVSLVSILFMSELVSMPEEFKGYSDTVQLVSAQGPFHCVP